MVLRNTGNFTKLMVYLMWNPPSMQQVASAGLVGVHWAYTWFALGAEASQKPNSITDKSSPLGEKVIITVADTVAVATLLLHAKNARIPYVVFLTWMLDLTVFEWLLAGQRPPRSLSTLGLSLSTVLNCFWKL